MFGSRTTRRANFVWWCLGLEGDLRGLERRRCRAGDAGKGEAGANTGTARGRLGGGVGGELRDEDRVVI